MRICPAISGVHRPQPKLRSRDRGYPSAYSSEWGLKLEILSSILRAADPLFMMRSRTWTKINPVRVRRSEKGCLETGGQALRRGPILPPTPRRTIGARCHKPLRGFEMQRASPDLAAREFGIRHQAGGPISGFRRWIKGPKERLDTPPCPITA